MTYVEFRGEKIRIETLAARAKISLNLLRQRLKSGRTAEESLYELLANKPKPPKKFGRHELYKVWDSMKQRCYNQNNPGYKNYGGRGIKVCDEWLNDFKRFAEDMGPKPTKNHSLDRIDNNKGYYKENCRWGTKRQQGNNRRTNILITYQGKTQNLTEWSKELGIPYHTLSNRRRNKPNISAEKLLEKIR